MSNALRPLKTIALPSLRARFSKRARHGFRVQIAGKFRNKVPNLLRDGGTKRRRSAGTFAQQQTEGASCCR